MATKNPEMDFTRLSTEQLGTNNILIEDYLKVLINLMCKKRTTGALCEWDKASEKYLALVLAYSRHSVIGSCHCTITK